jgi:hypothetical protein
MSTTVLAMACDLAERWRALRKRHPNLTTDQSWQLLQAEESTFIAECVLLEKPPPAYRYTGEVLVECAATVDVTEAPAEVVFMPAGQWRIRPRVNGIPKDVTVQVDENTAATLQRDLDARLAGNVRPHAGFDHKPGPASFLPKRFKWDSRGVVLEIDWTSAGKKAVEGKNYSYLSPVFLLDGERVAGLPKTGEVASLVNSPAFQQIPRIAASAADPGRYNAKRFGQPGAATHTGRSA